MKIAFATFVKTPGISPLKTRLAQGAGRDKADEFYLKSLEKTKALLNKLQSQYHNVDLFWAVAEKSELKNKTWSSWACVSQGEGDLGDRISKVYEDLKSKYDVVFLFGADSPHLLPEVLYLAVENFISSSVKPHVLGPTEDGGFYIFGSNQKIKSEVWKNILWSSSETAENLKKALALTEQNTLILPETFDIDEKKDLDRLLEIDPWF